LLKRGKGGKGGAREPKGAYLLLFETLERKKKRFNASMYGVVFFLPQFFQTGRGGKEKGKGDLGSCSHRSVQNVKAKKVKKRLVMRRRILLDQPEKRKGKEKRSMAGAAFDASRRSKTFEKGKEGHFQHVAPWKKKEGGEGRKRRLVASFSNEVQGEEGGGKGKGAAAIAALALPAKKRKKGEKKGKERN